MDQFPCCKCSNPAKYRILVNQLHFSFCPTHIPSNEILKEYKPPITKLFKFIGDEYSEISLTEYMENRYPICGN